MQAAPQQAGGRVCVADRIKAGLVCPPGGGEPFFGLGETAGQEVQPAKQRVPPRGGRRLRDHDRELSGRGRLAAAQKKLHRIKQQPVSIRAVRRQRGRLRQPDRSRPPGRHAARPAPSHHLISSSQSVDARIRQAQQDHPAPRPWPAVHDQPHDQPYYPHRPGHPRLASDLSARTPPQAQIPARSPRTRTADAAQPRCHHRPAVGPLARVPRTTPDPGRPPPRTDAGDAAPAS